jgi:hypothetical protein
MSARSVAARTTVAILTAAAFLAPAASAAAAPRLAEGGSFDPATCGRLETHSRPSTKLNLKVGKPGRFALTIATERPCVFDVMLRPLGRDTGIVVGPDQFVRITTPATLTWSVTGTKKADDVLVAAVRSGEAMFGLRLPDVAVR